MAIKWRLFQLPLHPAAVPVFPASTMCTLYELGRRWSRWPIEREAVSTGEQGEGGPLRGTVTLYMLAQTSQSAYNVRGPSPRTT